jgi:serine/threonine protein kinase
VKLFHDHLVRMYEFYNDKDDQKFYMILEICDTSVESILNKYHRKDGFHEELALYYIFDCF